MLRSVYLRFILINVLVVLLSVAFTAALAGRMTAAEYGRFVERGDVQRYQRLVKLLTETYEKSGNWDNVQSTIDGMGRIGGERVIVTNTDGVVLADSGKDLVGAAVSSNNLRPSGRISSSGATVGYLVINPRRDRPSENAATIAGSTGSVGQPPASQPPPVAPTFPETINRLVLTSAAIAAGLSILLTLFLTRRILRPVVALTEAAHRMEDGDMSVRVETKSKDEIGMLAHAFNAMADSLARTEQLRRNMVNDVAHELRTPLTNLRGYLEAARDGLVTPDARYVDGLYEETMLLTRLTDDLRDLALSEAGQLRLEMEIVDLGGLAIAAVEASRARAHDERVELICKSPDDLPPVNADPARVGQALRNLLNNALDFTPPGGQVSVAVSAVGSDVVVEVRDTGPGIDGEKLPFIFERFYRADPSRTRATGGAGLGLTIVKNLIEAQGGRAWVTSAVNGGSTFGFSLPVCQSG